MQLSKQTIKQIAAQPGLVIPDPGIFGLPESVLQFGTGVLLRGLPDYFIDKANRHGLFNGRIVVVKSTSSGGTDAFGRQDGLYTLCVRGIEEGKKTEEYIIHSAISRVLSAKSEWDKILACAHNPAMQVVISNTTEVGITLVEDDIHARPPHSFPGKLLAFLAERYKAFRGSEESGMVIVPTELIPDNGSRLREIVLELAAMNKLDEGFISWLKEANHFCNSLVDRIVPGRLGETDRLTTERKLGYRDELMIMAEPFRLWAIESASERVRRLLSFAEADAGVVIAPAIGKFRELKLRLLNGTHTFSCGLAHLAGFGTVREAMGNEFMSSFIHNLALHEIAPALGGESISYAEAREFAGNVMDRFRNPFLDHHWLSIAVQFTSKMKMRNIPLLEKYYSKTGRVPEHMALGFAAYLLFMKCGPGAGQQFTGMSNGVSYVLQDERAAYFAAQWGDNDIERLVDTVLPDTEVWGADLSALPGFAEAVKNNIRSLVRNGVMATLRRVQRINTTV